MVSRSFDPVQVRFWESKKITPLQGTFEEFMQSLDAVVGHETRGLAVVRPEVELSIEERFKSTNAVVSRGCRQFLENDVEYVKSINVGRTVDAGAFYKGMNPGWSAVEQGLDVRRQLGDTILAEHFLCPESEHSDRAEIIMIEAHAGAGKSVLLRRVAWDATRDYDCLCLYLKPYGVVNTAALQELIGLCDERIYLFIDDAADHLRDLLAIARSMGPEGRRLTVITAERINEWNVLGGPVATAVTVEHELKYLNLREIDKLLTLLEEHKALGTLGRLSMAERRRAFAEQAGRQLLVALHEATLGKPFEDIIVDEYNGITPPQAQSIYLTICVLNRLGVPVRAGIVARIHGVRFEEFKEKLFAPLEHVVEAEENPIIRDFSYRARHPHIAEIVFDRILCNPEDRFGAYDRCLKALNIDYKDDYNAFRQMVRGRSLIDVFPNHDLAVGVFDIALSVIGREPFLLHQMGIYEMNRPNGSFVVSRNLLSEASSKAPGDMNIRHSLAELSLKSADIARTPLERDRLLTKAAGIAAEVRSARADEVYGYHTGLKVGLARLKPLLEESEGIITDEIETLGKHLERGLSEALQRFPGDSYIYEAESQLASVLSDSDRMVEALTDAFRANSRVSFIASRLAKCLIARGNIDGAREVFEKALESNRSDARLHYSLSKLLIRQGDASSDALLYHLRRSFTPGDTNYDAQLLYARQLYIAGNQQYREMFAELKKARVGSNLKDKELYPLTGRFHGEVERVEAGHCFILKDGTRDWLFAHRGRIADAVWNKLTPGSRVSFGIAFSLRGVNAIDVDLA